VQWVRFTCAPAGDIDLWCAECVEECAKSGDAHEHDQRARTLVSRQPDFLACTTNACADNDRLGDAALGDRDTGEDGASKRRGDARHNYRLKTVLAEVDDFFACSTIYGWIALLELYGVLSDL
jgi:hypothetical protein